MQSQTQRTLLLGFIASIATCGAMGIYCLLIGSFGRLEAQILGSVAAVGAASILCLSAAVAWERHRWHPIGPVAALAVAVALALVLVGIWGESSLQEEYYRWMGSGCVIGVSLTHIALLSLARLRRGYEWVRYATLLAIAGLVGLIILAIWGTIFGSTSERTIGIVAIVDVCGTIAVPILHRISAIATREAIRTVELAITLTCPRCDTSQELPVGRSKCDTCGLKFVIDIEEEHCPNCGYALYKLTSSKCPECGTSVTRTT